MTQKAARRDDGGDQQIFIKRPSRGMFEFEIMNEVLGKSMS